MSVPFSRLLAAAVILQALGWNVAFADPCKTFSFSTPRQVAPGLKLTSRPLLGDFDENGKPDLLVQTTDGTFFLSGFGTQFAAPKPVAVRAGGILTAVGDFNGDGHLDAVVQTRSSEMGHPFISLSILLGDGRGAFAQTAEIATPLLNNLATGDFDGDGILDIAAFGSVTVNDNGLGDYLSPAVWLLKGDGRGGFSAGAPAITDLFGWPAFIVAADFDRDGKLDLVLSTDGWHCGTVDLFRGNGRGGFGPREGIVASGPLLFSGDLNGDGIPDLMTGCSYMTGPEINTSLAMGNGSFSRVSRASLYASGRWINAENLLVADFDGDGKADILVSSAAATGILRGDGKGGLGSLLPLFSSSAAWYAVDLNGDGRPDLISVGSDGLLNIRTNNCAGGGSTETTLLLPVVLSAGGAVGADYFTDLTLGNRGNALAVVDVEHTAFIGWGTTHVLVPLAGGEQKLCSDGTWDCIHTFSPYPRPWGGTLRLTFSNLTSADDVFALARIRSTTGNGDFGGVGLPAIPISSTLTGPSTVGWLRETSQDRSNLAVVNAGSDADGEIVLRVTAVSTDPLHPGTATLPDVPLAPGGFFQFDRILSASGLAATTGFARVDRVSGTAPHYTWGVINDNANGDGSIVSPLAAGALSGQTGLILPVVLEAGPFTSELVATNSSAVTKVIRFEWVSGEIALADRTARFQVTLAPGGQLYAPSFVEWLRARGVPGVGPPGKAYAGALFASVDNGDVEGLFLGTRIASPGKMGRYGVFVAALAASELATDSAWLYGLRQGSGNRTNLAIVNAGPADSGPSYFRIEIFDGGTGLLAPTIDDVRVDARSWRQLGMVLDEYSNGLANAYARVTRVSGWSPFVTYAVVNDGDAPGSGTGDGTFIPMRVGTPR